MLGELLQAPQGPTKERAWQEFLESYSRLILFVVRRTCSHYDTVMDRYTFVVRRLVDQDYRRLRAYQADGRAKFTTWLTVVVRRLCLDAIRREQRHPVLEHTADAPREFTDLDRLARVVPLHWVQSGPAGDAENADEELRRRERDATLKAAVAALPDEDRLLLALRFEDGLAVPEIARLMKLPTPFHVYRRLNRLMDTLRDALERRGIEGVAP